MYVTYIPVMMCDVVNSPQSDGRGTAAGEQLWKRKAYGYVSVNWGRDKMAAIFYRWQYVMYFRV